MVKQLEDSHTYDVYQFEARIAELKNQIADLRKLVFPTVVATPSKEAMEFDSVMNVSEKPPEMSEAELTQILAGEREFDLLISGNYDQDLLN